MKVIFGLNVWMEVWIWMKIEWQVDHIIITSPKNYDPYYTLQICIISELVQIITSSARCSNWIPYVLVCKILKEFNTRIITNIEYFSKSFVDILVH